MGADRAGPKGHKVAGTESFWNMFLCAPWILRFVDIGDVSVAHDQLSIRARRESFSENRVKNVSSIWEKI